MKKWTWLLYIAIIAVTGLLIGFTAYTTDPVKTTTTKVGTATTTEAVGLCSHNRPPNRILRLFVFEL